MNDAMRGPHAAPRRAELGLPGHEVGSGSPRVESTDDVTTEIATETANGGDSGDHVDHGPVRVLFTAIALTPARMSRAACWLGSPARSRRPDRRPDPHRALTPRLLCALDFTYLTSRDAGRRKPRGAPERGHQPWRGFRPAADCRQLLPPAVQRASTGTSLRTASSRGRVVPRRAEHPARSVQVPFAARRRYIDTSAVHRTRAVKEDEAASWGLCGLRASSFRPLRVVFRP